MQTSNTCEIVIQRLPYVYSITFEGKTFTFRVENGYLLENFHGSMRVANRQGYNLWGKVHD